MLKIPAWTLEQKIAPNNSGYMKRTEEFLLTMIIICSLSACAQNINRTKDYSVDLQTLIFKRNNRDYSNIHVEKATFEESIDDSGWIKRIQENLFGFPNFNKEVVEKINSEIASRAKDTAVTYYELYHEITTEKVKNFFTRKDRNLLRGKSEQQNERNGTEVNIIIPLLILYLH